MTIDSNHKSIPMEVDSPRDRDFGYGPILIDMTGHANIQGRALRVELRRTRDPLTGPVNPAKRIVDENFIIGLMSSEDLPQEGKNFRMPYHNFNNFSDFGTVDSQEPLIEVLVDGPCYYFSTTEGQWRLKIINVGN